MIPCHLWQLGPRLSVPLGAAVGAGAGLCVGLLSQFCFWCLFGESQGVELKPHRHIRSSRWYPLSVVPYQIAPVSPNIFEMMATMAHHGPPWAWWAMATLPHWAGPDPRPLRSLSGEHRWGGGGPPRRPWRFLQVGPWRPAGGFLVDFLCECLHRCTIVYSVDVNDIHGFIIMGNCGCPSHLFVFAFFCWLLSVCFSSLTMLLSPSLSWPPISCNTFFEQVFWSKAYFGVV